MPTRFIRLAAVALGVAPVLALPAISGPAAAAPTPRTATATLSAAASTLATTYRVRAVTIPVRVGPNNGVRCTIVADLYRPVGVDRFHKAPAILTTNGFGGAKDDSNQKGIGKGFAQEGYVVLSYSGLGFGGSDCRIYLDNPVYDGKAGKQLVSVLAGGKRAYDEQTGKPFRIRYVAKEAPGDPKVGMIGGSYGGQIQYAVAMQDKRLDALIPIITWNDLTYSLAPNNTSFRRGVTYATPGVYKKQWTNLFFAVGIRDGVAGAGVDPDRNEGCPNFDRRACTAKVQLDKDGYPNATTTRFARGHASVTSYLGRITTPTLVVQGQADTLFNLQEAVATFKGLRAQGTPTRMIWQSWGHSEGGTPAPGEVDLGSDSIRDTYLGRRFVRWMNHYVRGNSEVPLGSRFCYFRDWIRYDTSPGQAGRAVTRAYQCRDTYVGDDRNERLFFTGNDGLTRIASHVRRGSQTYANVSEAPTSYSETSALEGTEGHSAPPSDDPGTFAAFTSRPLARAANLVGTPVLRVHLQVPTAAAIQDTNPATRLVLFAKIYDVAPDGSIRLHHRLISPVRVPDVTEPVRIELPGVVQRLRPGHRIRVVLAASDFAYSGNKVAHTVTVTTAPRKPSVLRLPLATGRLYFR